MAKTEKFDHFFEKRGGEGLLALYFGPGPYGNGVEANEGHGIGFFSESGELLAVQFDRVLADKDRQILRFENGTLVEISVDKGKVRVTRSRLVPRIDSVA